jgi:hypothetical protein
MNYKLLEGKSVAEGNAFEISPEVLTNANGYYYVIVKTEEGEITLENHVYLSKRLTKTMQERKTTFIPKEAVFRMTVNADGEERFKLGSPPIVLVPMSTIPSWG